ncbi:MAG: substrate-binding domain-containing protein [Albidovulum sp.]|nr:substrate-binding domain-containing protein [Albidovulum sp.]
MPFFEADISSGNDELALQVACAVFSCSLGVPDDIGVVGFDHFQEITDVFRPKLTTIQLPYVDMGRQAVRSLMALLQEPDAEHESKCISCKLAVRDSVRRNRG